MLHEPLTLLKMFLRYHNLLINLSSLHIELNDNLILLYDGTRRGIVYTLSFSSPSVASFAFGRITHGMLKGWGCVDVTGWKIAGVMNDVQNANADRK